MAKKQIRFDDARSARKVEEVNNVRLRMIEQMAAAYYRTYGATDPRHAELIEERTNDGFRWYYQSRDDALTPDQINSMLKKMTKKDRTRALKGIQIATADTQAGA